jgi:4-hydroxy-tetrahydrodipicolinate synthase
MTSMIDATARGVFPIAVTPFLDDGAIDLASMDRLIDFFIEIGVPGITILGLLGEANKLSKIESLQLVKLVARRANGRAKIIVGTSQAGYDELESFTKAALAEGAAGFMVAPAPNLRTEDQILGYFEAVAARIGDGVPIALQDYPQSTGVFMSADTIGRIVERVPGVQIIKHEEGSALRKITKLRAQEKARSRRRVSMLVGNSGLHLPQELARGVDGANTGVAFPEMLIAVCERYFKGDAEGGETLYDIFLPLIRHEWQVGIGLAIRKEIFRRRGLIATARARAPGPSLDSDDQKELSRLLSRLTRRLEETGEIELIKSYRITDPTAVH